MFDWKFLGLSSLIVFSTFALTCAANVPPSAQAAAPAVAAATPQQGSSKPELALPASVGETDLVWATWGLVVATGLLAVLGLFQFFESKSASEATKSLAEATKQLAANSAKSLDIQSTVVRPWIVPVIGQINKRSHALEQKVREKAEELIQAGAAPAVAQQQAMAAITPTLDQVDGWGLVVEVTNLGQLPGVFKHGKYKVVEFNNRPERPDFTNGSEFTLPYTMPVGYQQLRAAEQITVPAKQRNGDGSPKQYLVYYSFHYAGVGTQSDAEYVTEDFAVVNSITGSLTSYRLPEFERRV